MHSIYFNIGGEYFSHSCKYTGTIVFTVHEQCRELQINSR